VNTPRRIASEVNIEKKISIWFSHELEVGVKLGCLVSQAATAGCLCVA
jgi:hypothetical protein